VRAVYGQVLLSEADQFSKEMTRWLLKAATPYWLVSRL